MKKVLWMFFVSAVILAASAYAEEATWITGGESRTAAVKLMPGIIYETKAGMLNHSQNEDSVKTGWFLLEPTSTGTCYIYIHDVKGDRSFLRTYDSNGYMIEMSDYFERNKTAPCLIDVVEGEAMYVRFFCYVGTKSYPTFSICYSDTHVWDYTKEIILTEATCTNTGDKVVARCSLCSAFQSEKIPVIPHTPDEWLVQHPATCTTAGEMVQRCTMCNGTISTETIPATGHNPGGMTVVKSATCLAKGLKEKYCQTCGTVLESDSIPKSGHTPGTMQTISLPSCLEKGRREQRCQICQELLDEETIPAYGHVEGEWEMVYEAKCVQTGLRAKYCVTCYAELAREVLPVLGHSYTEWETTIEATKNSEGEKTRHCIYCGDTQFQTIPKKKKFLGIF